MLPPRKYRNPDRLTCGYYTGWAAENRRACPVRCAHSASLPPPAQSIASAAWPRQTGDPGTGDSNRPASGCRRGSRPRRAAGRLSPRQRGPGWDRGRPRQCRPNPHPESGHADQIRPCAPGCISCQSVPSGRGATCRRRIHARQSPQSAPVPPAGQTTCLLSAVALCHCRQR